MNNQGSEVYWPRKTNFIGLSCSSYPCKVSLSRWCKLYTALSNWVSSSLDSWSRPSSVSVTAQPSCHLNWHISSWIFAMRCLFSSWWLLGLIGSSWLWMERMALSIMMLLAITHWARNICLHGKLDCVNPVQLHMPPFVEDWSLSSRVSYGRIPWRGILRFWVGYGFSLCAAPSW